MRYIKWHHSKIFHFFPWCHDNYVNFIMMTSVSKFCAISWRGWFNLGYAPALHISHRFKVSLISKKITNALGFKIGIWLSASSWELTKKIVSKINLTVFTFIYLLRFCVYIIEIYEYETVIIYLHLKNKEPPILYRWTFAWYFTLFFVRKVIKTLHEFEVPCEKKPRL